MIYLWATLLVILNTVWLLLNVLGLPGNWLMVAGAALLAWWQWDHHMFSVWTLVAAASLAAAGEVLEFIAGLAGSRRAGASRWGAFGALAGGLLGAVFGTVLVPVPIVGSLLGACAGAFGGAMGLELLGGRKVRQSVRSGVGAGVGRFLGTSIKFVIGVVIWVILAVAAFWP